MVKECTCKDGKTDPNCPVCSKKIDYLKDFHKLNPEAKPSKKTAGLFSAPAKGFFGGMDPAMKTRLLEGAKNTAIPALAAGLPAAVLAGATADKGEGTGDAVRAGLLAGGASAAAHFGHSAMMGGSSPWAHSYQRGIGTDIRNIANKGREAMGMPTVAPARPPKVASVDSFKIAYPEDPYANYGQYGHDKRDDEPGLGSTLALGGIGALGAGALHSGLMSSNGQFARGYQANLGNAIRESTNRARKSVGIDQVPLPPHGIVGKAQDLAHGVNEAVKNVHGAVAPVMAIGSTAAAGGAAVNRIHNKVMGMENPVGNAYKRFVGAPIEKAVGSAGERLKEWVNRPAAAKQTEGEMGKIPEKVKATPQQRQTKPSATRYRAYVPGQGYATPSAPSGTPVQKAINAARTGGGAASPGILQSMANRLRGTMKKSSLDSFLLQSQG